MFPWMKGLQKSVNSHSYTALVFTHFAYLDIWYYICTFLRVNKARTRNMDNQDVQILKFCEAKAEHYKEQTKDLNRHNEDSVNTTTL